MIKATLGFIGLMTLFLLILAVIGGTIGILIAMYVS